MRLCGHAMANFPGGDDIQPRTARKARKDQRGDYLKEVYWLALSSHEPSKHRAGCAVARHG
jgi:hypothetical protein